MEGIQKRIEVVNGTVHEVMEIHATDVDTGKSVIIKRDTVDTLLTPEVYKERLEKQQTQIVEVLEELEAKIADVQEESVDEGESEVVDLAQEQTAA